jgi:vacuolar protein sorting-associated protein 13A/C
MIKFAKLKGLYDAAAQAAAQRASEIQRMQFDISIQSPILVFPQSPINSEDTLVMKLGEISARNAYQGATIKTMASLKGIQLTSETYYGTKISPMKIIDEVEVTADIEQKTDIDRSVDLEHPDSQVCKSTIALLSFALLIKYYRSWSRYQTLNYILLKCSTIF